MSETRTHMSRPQTSALSDSDAVFFRDAMFFLAIAFALVALVVTVAVRY
jgi:hypothetical protein